MAEAEPQVQKIVNTLTKLKEVAKSYSQRLGALSPTPTPGKGADKDRAKG